MARNKYLATCVYCRKTVAPGAGMVDRSVGFARVIHADCAVKRRDEKKAQNGLHKRL